MKFTIIAAIAAFASVVVAHGHGHGNGTEVTITETVSSYTTFCPLPTTIVENNVTYTVTKATTLTISNCPCTRTKTYTTVTKSVCAGGCPGAETPVVVYPNTTVVIPTGKPITPPATNGSSSVPTPPAQEGSASRATLAGGALAGIVGIVAYLL